LPGELTPSSRAASSPHNAATVANAATRRIPLISPGISGSLGETGTPASLPRREPTERTGRKKGLATPASNVVNPAIAHQPRWAMRGFTTLVPG
jgi:hypothetical protein